MKSTWKWASIQGLVAVFFMTCSTSAYSPPPPNYSYYVYAISSETIDGIDQGYISAFKVNPDNGALTEVGDSPFATAVSPRSLAADPSAKSLYMTHPAAGDISAFMIDAATGMLTAVPGSPFAAGEYPYSLAVDPAGRFVYVRGTRQTGISAFTVNAATGALTEIPGSPFAAGEYPNSLAVDPSGRFAYVAGGITEGGSSQPCIFAFDINSGTGALTEMAGSPFAFRAYISGPSHGKLSYLAVDPFGKFIFGVAAESWNFNTFRIDAHTGALTEVPLSPFNAGAYPGELAVDPSGKFAYVMYTGGIGVFKIDAASGALTEIPGSAFAVGYSSSIALSPSGSFAYVITYKHADGLFRGFISAFLINADTGALTEIAGSPFGTGRNFIDLTVIRIAQATR